MVNRRTSSRQSSGLEVEASDDASDCSSSSTRQQQQQLHHRHEAQLPSAFVIQVTALASLGGILFGYDLGVISGALPQLKEAFALTNSQQELVVSILYLGGGIGATLGGSICDVFGRKRAILLTDVWFLIGAFVLYAAPVFEVILVGRIIVGFAVAVSGVADVSYLHEIAPIQWRGAIVSVNEACISLGFLLAFGMGSLLSAEGNTTGWRGMFGASGFVALLQLVGMWSMPESPTWLKEQGRHEESEAAMRRINSNYSLFYGRQDDDESAVGRESTTTVYDAVVTTDATSRRPESISYSSLEVLAVTAEPTFNNSGLVGRCRDSCCQIIYLVQQLYGFAKETATKYRKQAYIALFLAVTQQFCGQTNVLSYAPIIFAGVSGKDAAASSSFVRGWATLSIGLVKFAVTVLVIWKIESLGRRFLLLLGMGTIAIGLFLLTIAFQGAEIDETKTEDVVSSAGGGMFLAMPGVLLVVCGYSMSFGPLTWLLTSELFPTDIRGRALGMSTIVTYLCAALVTFTFLSSQDRYGTSAVFTFYLVVTCLGLIFAYMAIPDTKEKTVPEIEQSLRQMPWWRGKHNDASDTSPLFGRDIGDDGPSHQPPESELT